MLLVRSKEDGAVVFGPKGTRYLDQDRVEGEDPTTLFGPHTIMSLKREDAMTHAPDLLLLSQYDPELGEVAAFEELIGSHGGLGGPQTEPFILHPVEWTLDEEVPLGAPAIYRNIRRWLDSIGIPLGQAAGAGRGGLHAPRARSRSRRPSGKAMARLHYEADGAGQCRPIHRRADRLQRAPPGAVARPRREVLRAPRARRHVGRGDRGDRHPRRRMGARALRLVGTGIVRLRLVEAADFRPGRSPNIASARARTAVATSRSTSSASPPACAAGSSAWPCSSPARAGSRRTCG